MRVIHSITKYQLEGIDDPGQQRAAVGVDPETAVAKPFSARLAFLKIDDGSQGAILPALLQHHAPPRTEIFEDRPGGGHCTVIYEITSGGKKPGSAAHFDQAMELARAHCEKKRGGGRQLLSAEEFLKLSPESFNRITQEKLGCVVIR